MLTLTDISHGYGDHQVLSHVNLTLGPGQRMALMGPSGCGKTTLLRIALGLQVPTSGQVRNDFRKTAVVFQEPRLLPWRTALENVNLVLGDRRDTLEKAREALKRVELEAGLDKYPVELSGGMQQRVALARALAAEGDLLILDEPFKAMDEALRLRMVELVAENQGAILLVTHEPEEAKLLHCEILSLV